MLASVLMLAWFDAGCMHAPRLMRDTRGASSQAGRHAGFGGVRAGVRTFLRGAGLKHWVRVVPANWRLPPLLHQAVDLHLALRTQLHRRAWRAHGAGQRSHAKAAQQPNARGWYARFGGCLAMARDRVGTPLRTAAGARAWAMCLCCVPDACPSARRQGYASLMSTTRRCASKEPPSRPMISHRLR